LDLINLENSYSRLVLLLLAIPLIFHTYFRGMLPPHRVRLWSSLRCRRRL